MQLPEKLVQMLRVLQKSPTERQKVLAGELNMNPVSFCRKLGELRAAGYIKPIHFVLDAEKLGFSALAFFEVEFTSAQSAKAAEETFASWTEVLEMYTDTGSGWNFLLKVRGTTFSKLCECQKRISQMEGVCLLRVRPRFTKKETTLLPI